MKSSSKIFYKTVATTAIFCLAVILCTACTRLPSADTDSCAEPPAVTESPAPTEEPATRIQVLDKSLPVSSKDIRFSSMIFTDGDIRELIATLPQFPQLETVTITRCGLSFEQYEQLVRSLPDIRILCFFDLCGKTVRSDAEEIDFSGMEIGSVEEIVEAVPYLHNLKKINMTDCGKSDEELEEINNRCGDVQIVWTLHIGPYDIRTDAIGFRAYSASTGMWTKENLDRLWYCHDMIAMDWGHRYIRDLEFLYGMPHMKYFLMLDGRPRDITPIGSLKELVFLEMVGCWIDDLTPILRCESLEDLNIVCIWGEIREEDIVSVLKKMDKLNRVWLDNKLIPSKDLKELQNMYPDTLYHAVNNYYRSTEDPWRYNQNYYDMRDALQMYYMNGAGTYITWKIIDGVRYDLDEDFIKQQMETTIGDQ